MQHLFHQCHRHCFRGCCDWHRKRKAERPAAPVLSNLRVIAAKFLLEVLGAAGAMWGAADVLSLRDTPDGVETTRLVALTVGGVFLVRHWWHAKHWWQHEREFLPVKTIHRRTFRLAFVQIHAAKLVLQVLGGTGAIWGSAEALTLRTQDNATAWRMASMAVGTTFLVRWVFQVVAYCLCLPTLWSNPSLVHMTLLRWHKALVVMFILEVLGAAGAVWGFSEIVTLRTPETNDHWRPIAIAVGFVFLVRWLLHLFDFIRSEQGSDAATAKRQVQEEITHYEEVEYGGDLQLQETSDMESFDASIAMTNMQEEGVPPPQDEQASPTSVHLSRSTPQKRQRKQLSNNE